jgi:bifunctional N-acetylglutamate synthase/kinase
MVAANAALVAALRKEGVDAAPCVGNVFAASRDDNVKNNVESSVLTLGTIKNCQFDTLESTVAAGRIPVVAALGKSETCDANSSQFLTFPTQAACLALARGLKPLKVIWLRPEGGLRSASSESNPVVRSIDLTDPVSTIADLIPEDAALVPELKALYEAAIEGSGAGAGVSVAVTKPEFLASELLSSGGAGTQVLRRERIQVHSSEEKVDLSRVVSLIENAFNATLPKDYFARLISGEDGRKLRRIYVSEGYRAVAVVTEEAGLPGVAYLDKFAVVPSAQGDRLGETLWRVMVENEAGGLYWRSRSANNVNQWYFEQATGAFKSGDWSVFWRGIQDSQVMTAVSVALALKPTFPLRVYPKSSPTSGNASEQPQLK